jgi:pyruvate/2-oxoglutarate dehydrogenase complex dihydrolipoamide acyltransferase (E2) component
MPITIEMPKLSDTMTEWTLVKWIKKVGDTVAVGDVLAEVETDKATMEIEAFDEGVLSEIYVNDGEKVQIGQKLALLVGQGETAGSEGSTDPDDELIVRIPLPGFVKSQPMGLGTVLKHFTSAVGIKPCAGCDKRAAALNRRVVFGRRPGKR